MYERITKDGGKRNKSCKRWGCTHTHTHTSTFNEIAKRPYLIIIWFINNTKIKKDGLFSKLSRILKNRLSFLYVLEVINTKDKYAWKLKIKYR